MNLNGEMVGTECRFQRQRYGKSINQSHADLSSICIWLQETTLSLLPASPRAAQESAMRLLPRVQGKHRPSGTSTTDRPGWFHRLRYHGSRLSSSYYCKCPSRMLSVITQHCCLQSSHSRTLGYRLERWYSSQEYALTVLSGNLSA